MERTCVQTHSDWPTIGFIATADLVGASACSTLVRMLLALTRLNGTLAFISTQSGDE